MHLDYQTQLQAKRRMTVEAFARCRAAAGLLHSLPLPYPSPRRFRYRTRVRLHRSGKRLGFRRRGSARVVPVGDCLVLHPRLQETLRLLDAAGATLKEERFTLRRTIMWRPFIVDLRDTRLSPRERRRYTIGVPDPREGVAAAMGHVFGLPGVSAMIVGTINLDHLRQNVEIVEGILR